MLLQKQPDCKHEIILDSIADGVFTVDLEWKITSFNRAAEKITGIPREEALGRLCSDVFRANICETDCALKKTMLTKKPIINKPVYIINARGKKIPISVSTAVFKDELGKIIGGVETFRDLSMVEELRKELTKRHRLDDIISKNYEMQKIFAILPEIAASGSTVLIEGPSGSGKELFAKAIHNLSQRRKKPFVAVNCAAMPDTLLESELFGYVAGAFTDAKKNKPGRFALAQGGTIFLDEISDISPALQIRLLRVLQEREFEPLGGTRPIRADVRVLVSTNKSLEAMVREGRFRDDLYYRINVVKIILPPLSERKEDIPLLIDHIINRFNRLRGKDISGVSEETVAMLMHHDYPGNVRELENIIEHAFILCRSGLIEPDHLPSCLIPKESGQLPVMASLTAMERRCIYETLMSNNWNRLATARELGINKTTLWRKMKKLNISAPKPGQ
ncbi:MAG: sigma 54-interacting transcriptional regulator [Thermodesulfobacteriota bacterium]|nr:sigma 54-interacting transcriptional regulator [Thermodesulfobacteriota bacterium]